MRGIPVVVLAGAGMLMLVTSVAAQSPVAVVEEVKGKPIGVEFMDYVTVGKVIKLGPKDSIVLGYMKSCWRETIVGGTVVVGTDQSMVHLGEVARVKVDCDAEKVQLTDQQASQSAGMAFRNAFTPASGQGVTSWPASGQDAPQPQITLYGLSPVVEINGGGNLIIERIDAKGERHEVAAGRSARHTTFYDFAKTNKALTAGGVYRASLGTQKIVFKVDSQAKSGSTPIIGRLLRFPPG